MVRILLMLAAWPIATGAVVVIASTFGGIGPIELALATIMGLVVVLAGDRLIARRRATET